MTSWAHNGIKTVDFLSISYAPYEKDPSAAWDLLQATITESGRSHFRETERRIRDFVLRTGLKSDGEIVLIQFKKKLFPQWIGASIIEGYDMPRHRFLVYCKRDERIRRACALLNS